MKLYEVKPNSRIKIGEHEFNFHHIDGLYSYCTTDDGKVVHIAAWEDVEVINEPVKTKKSHHRNHNG